MIRRMSVAQIASALQQALGRPVAGDVVERVRLVVEEAIRGHPTIELAEEVFVSHLAHHVATAPDTDAALGVLCGADLLLACACGMGDAQAIGVLERDHMAQVARYVARLRATPDTIDDVTQALRVKLLVVDEGRRAGILAYAGRAPLGTWLRVAAVRTVRARLRRRAQDLPFRGEADLAESLTRGDPEVDLQKQEGAALFRGALTRSLAEFGHRERTLLRLYFAEGTSLAALGRMYHVHESTMQRRILALRERLLHEVKSQLGLDSRGLASRMDLIRSQLDLHLSQLLKPQCPR